MVMSRKFFPTAASKEDSLLLCGYPFCLRVLSFFANCYFNFFPISRRTTCYLVVLVSLPIRFLDCIPSFSDPRCLWAGLSNIIPIPKRPIFLAFIIDLPYLTFELARLVLTWMGENLVADAKTCWSSSVVAGKRAQLSPMNQVGILKSFPNKQLRVHPFILHEGPEPFQCYRVFSSFRVSFAHEFFLWFCKNSILLGF